MISWGKLDGDGRYDWVLQTSGDEFPLVPGRRTCPANLVLVERFFACLPAIYSRASVFHGGAEFLTHIGDLASTTNVWYCAAKSASSTVKFWE